MNDRADAEDHGPDAESLRFDEAVDKLQGVIDRIESGDVPLEESLRQYARGMQLVHRCRTILTAAEKQIAQLTEQYDGRTQVRDEAADAEASDDTEA